MRALSLPTGPGREARGPCPPAPAAEEAAGTEGGPGAAPGPGELEAEAGLSFPAGALLFVADVHLTPSFPERTRAFLRFLERLGRPPRPAALYVLGDLFDVWLGRPSLGDPRHRPALRALSSLSESGVAVTVLQGNRDFLLDGRFAREAGVALVPEWLALRLGTRRALLCHGDRLPVGDRAHQRMRWVLRSAAARALAQVFPDSWIRGAARWLRRKSEAAGERRRPDGPAVPPEVAARIFRGGYQVLIAGHLHRARLRTLLVDGAPCRFYTLGAWEERGSVLVFDGRSFQFQTFPILEAALDPLEPRGR